MKTHNGETFKLETSLTRSLCFSNTLTIVFAKTAERDALHEQLKIRYAHINADTPVPLQTRSILLKTAFNILRAVNDSLLEKWNIRSAKALLTGRKNTVAVPIYVSIKKVKIPIVNSFPGVAPTEGTFNAEWIDQPHDNNDDIEPNRVILYLHGSAYVTLSRRTHRGITWRIAAIDYRLAPENVYPAALIDALSAYSYLLDPPNGSKKYKPSQISFVGDSAGGGLAIAAMLYCRNTGMFPIPGCVATMSPWLDLTQSLPSWKLNHLYDYLPHTGRDPKYFTETRSNLYTTHDSQLTDEYVSPAFSSETKIPIPPTLIQVGGAERLRDDGIYFSRKIFTNSGVTLEIYQDQPHVFQVMSFFHPLSKLALQRLGAFIRENSGGSWSVEAPHGGSFWISNGPEKDISLIENAEALIDDGCIALIDAGIWKISDGTITLQY